MPYDQNNIFAKILRKEIPCEFIYKSQHTVAFMDITPQAPIHILVIPKGPYKSLTDFSSKATAEEQHDFHRTIAAVIVEQDLKDMGYRAVCNTGDHGGQEVPHFHMHLLGGEKLPPMMVEAAVPH